VSKSRVGDLAGLDLAEFLIVFAEHDKVMLLGTLVQEGEFVPPPEFEMVFLAGLIRRISL
jgi:hypothetical protein